MTMKANEQITRTIPEHAFRSIGLPDAELMLVKSELHSAIKAAILKNGWNQKQAGEHLGWGQPDVSKIMNDRFSQHSVERLIKAALDLDLTVSFGVGTAKSKREAGRIGLVEIARSAAATRKSDAARAPRRPVKTGRARASSAATYAVAE
jgi:predicted XRE-type DNA-binding protein